LVAAELASDGLEGRVGVDLACMVGGAFWAGWTEFVGNNYLFIFGKSSLSGD
jgi:hypothetical protein